MGTKTLHIINGDGLAKKVQELQLPGDQIIWRELLCEGPTTKEINAEFFKLRKKFLKKAYNIGAEHYEELFISEVKKLRSLKEYNKIVLWFEFDLFCHINMLSAINMLVSNKLDAPVYLVCSKKLEGEKKTRPLGQLSVSELKNHFNYSIQLNTDDIEAAILIWELYCSDDPLKLKAQIKTQTNFESLSSCLRAHIERFPNSITGINSLERNILKLIDTHEISSRNQLLGYALEYQGYYGYSDSQMQSLIKKLSLLFEETKNKILLTEAGKQALNAEKNFYRELQNNEFYGGTRIFDFLYISETHHLLKL
ncbi:DUF1835 domain-containing protein [Christiangramia aquimixticola]|uniref:DUF1835 domain-containing protein n=1 Tax=Christiangramia aquimixticola TaxID=1697558 RepID=UPI003AA9CADA